MTFAEPTRHQVRLVVSREQAVKAMANARGHIVHVPTVPAELATQTGWTARIQPLGATCIPDDAYGRFGRAEAIHCTCISAWCVGGTPTVKPLTRRCHPCHQLVAGLLVGYPIGHEQPHLLLPICDQDDLLASDALLAFQIREGQVYFSRRR